MDKRRNHIIFWVGYFMYYYIMYLSAYKSLTPTVLLNTSKVCFGSCYLFYLYTTYILPSVMPLKKYFKLAGYVILSFLFASILNYSLSLVIHNLFPKSIEFLPITREIARALISEQQSFSLALIFWFSKMFIENVAYESILQKKQNLLRSTILNTELLALKNQINPHFFYNMLNFFYAQSLPYSINISNSILKLSDMMRHTIRDNIEDSSVALESEIKYLRNYVDLENISEHSKMKININGNPKFRRINSLIFQPILCHSYVFGCKIVLNITIEDSYIIFSSNYIKKADAHILHIFESVENIKQKLSNIKGCNTTFQFDEFEHSFQLLLIS
jgi:two-component system LytT family sensor kinase